MTESKKSAKSAKDSSSRTDATTVVGDRGPIAIVGMSGRFPKSKDLDALWANLKAGIDCVGEADGSRWDLGHHIAGSDLASRVYTKAGGYLDRIDLFDAEFFGMSPREARQVDPQHRLLLELTWEALEEAGIVPASIAGSRTGVFVGISQNDYASLADQPVDAYTNIGSAMSIAANRISYVFDLHGPSLSIDTACSSSLVAFHQACQSIAAGSCDAAIVGGVNILASMRPFAGFAQASMLSPDGRCKSFDADGKGYVRAEGGGIVILKPLADAERDGDRILAVVAGTGVNSDGRTMGMALPSGDAQEALLRQVYGACGVAPDDVFYLEAHGTGTAAGDPIECGAIGRVLGAPRRDGSSCLIGSIKSNIGHLESGAGVAGLIKVLLALRHGEIPANLHFRTPNPKIDFEGSRLKVVAAPVALPATEAPLYFGINSFGFGGTNAHVVLRRHAARAAGTVADARVAGPKAPLILSARSAESLEALARAHAEGLAALPADRWDAWRATAALMRARHPNRIAVSADGPAAAADKLTRLLAGETVAGAARLKASGSGRLAFVFSGNGPQWWGMGRELLAADPVFRAEIEAIDAIFAPLAGWSIVEMMGRPRDQVPIGRTEVAQPLLFAEQAGLVASLRAAGVVPAVVFGHSVGEAAAAYASGALDRGQATTVIFHRSRLQATTAGRGRMAAVALDAEEAARRIADLSGWLEVAAVNAPKAVTLAGDADALQDLCDLVTDEGRFARVLPLDYAFHTAAMDTIEAPLAEALAGLAPGATAVTYVSTVTGGVLDGAALGADYWWRNIRAPVQFAGAVETALRREGVDVFLEIGPHPVLRDYVLQTAKATEAGARAVVLATLRRPSDTVTASEPDQLETAVAAAYAAGAVNPAGVFARPAEPAPLPSYPWNRTTHWRGGWELPDVPAATKREHPILGRRTPGADGLWTNTVQAVHLGYLNDHVVQGAPLFPAAGYIEMVLAAGTLTLGATVDIELFDIQKPMVLAEGLEPVVQTTVEASDGTTVVRSRPSLDAPDWTDHAKGRVSRFEAAADERGALDLDALEAAMPVVVSAAAHYADCARRGLVYGPAFQGVGSVRLTPADAARRMALGSVALPDLEGRIADYRAHPSVVDSALQVLITLIAQNDPRDCATIPVQVGRVRWYAPVPARIRCLVELRSESPRSGVADITLLDLDGRPVMVLSEARFQKVEFRGSALPITAEDWRPDPLWVARGPAVADRPVPSAILAAAEPALAAVTTAFGRRARDETVVPRLDALIGAYAAAALRDVHGADHPFTIAGLVKSGRIAEDRRDLAARLVAMAEADGALVRNEMGMSPVFAWSKTAAPVDPEALRKALLLDHPELGAEAIAVARAGGQLVARLTGAAPAVPDVAMREMLEDTAPYRMPSNRIAAELLRAAVAAWPAGRAIRIVETDAGTGGLTASLLPVLPPERSDYLFADASEQAVAKARNRFDAHHFLRTAAAPAADLGEAGFDVAVTAGGTDPADLFRLVAPGGLVLLVAPAAGRMADLLLATTPTLDLAAAGFEAVTVVDDRAGAETGSPLHTVTLARRPSGAAAEAPRPAVAPAKRVLVVGPAEAGTPFVAALAASLREAGQTVVVRTLDPAAVTDAAVSAIVDEEVDATEFVHLAGWAGPVGAGEPEGLDRQDLRCLSAVMLARAIELKPMQEGGGETGTLTIVTRGAFATPGGAPPLDPFQATVAGTARVIANEQVAVGCRLVDVHAATDDVEAGRVLADALLARDDETETMLVDGRRWLHRTRRSSIAEQTRVAGNTTAGRDGRSAFRLDFVPGGGLESLHLREIHRREPGPGEVEIRIRGAGLNFRDVLWAMGMLPEDAVEKGFSGPTIGMECAGEIVRVGEGVTAFRPGDRVVAFASSCFASHVTTAAGSVGRLPDGIGFEAAATIPTAFVTAWYALDHLARIEPGETVLIHGAAGGVGLAALQIAKLKGAVVIATAGANDKQKLVRTMGADHVLSSRSLRFADDVMRLTGGQGVDVVLNSLAGEAITKGLQVLKPFGRFLEIGKRDLYANSRIGLRPFRQNLSYFGIDADTLLVERPAVARRVFDQVLAALEKGDLKPLPYQLVPVSRAAEAFRAMQQARHVGKLVVGLDAEPHEGLAIVASGARVVRPDATWLVTGGLGGFGLATAEWLVARGARSLALVGRRGDTTEEARAGIARMRAAGAEVRAFAADVADRAAVDRVLAEVRATMKPLKGIVHSAAVIEDAPLLRIDRGLMQRVMAAKMMGAWHLHEATLDDGLDAFVLYSSSSVTVGNPGQGAYAAANAFLNALAEYRRGRGLPALAIGWGAIKDVGFLTRNQAVEEMLETRAGMAATPARVALAELGRLLASGATAVAAAQFNMMRLGQSLAGARTPRFSSFFPEGMAVSVQGAGSMADALAVMSDEDRRAALLACVTEQVARVVGSAVSLVEPTKPLSELGLDSLMAVELAEALEQTVGRPVSVMQMIQAGTVAGVVEVVARGFASGRSAAAEAPAASAKIAA